MTHHITINTDGACYGNPGPGGFAAIIDRNGQQTTISGGDPDTTNNQMEMAAIIEALKHLNAGPEHGEIALEIRSDSTYVIHAFTKDWISNWRRAGFNTRKNGNLWAKLDQLTIKRNITWTWVRGHSGDPMNELCDRIAVACSHDAKAMRQYWSQMESDCLVTKPEPPVQELEPEPPSHPEPDQYAKPDTSNAASDALQHNARAATCAELAMFRYDAGNRDEAWQAMRTALDQLAKQREVLEKLLTPAG